MSLVSRRHESGLTLAEQAMDERSLNRAIQQINPRYVLYRTLRDGVEGGYVYKVVYRWSDDHDALPVLTWMDDYGNPLPLSSGIVDLVQKHQLGARNAGPDADTFNQTYEARLEAEQEELGRELVREHAPRIKGRIQVSLAHKQRRQGWQKQNGGRINR